jgi:hypothetical protein
MTNICEQPDSGPTCFLDVLKDEYRRARNKHMRFLFRYHLSKYPVDLVQFWWRQERVLPWPTSQLAFEAYKAGIKAGDFRLYKGPRWKPQLTLMDGGKAGRALTLGKQ